MDSRPRPARRRRSARITQSHGDDNRPLSPLGVWRGRSGVVSIFCLPAAHVDAKGIAHRSFGPESRRGRSPGAPATSPAFKGVQTIRPIPCSKASPRDRAHAERAAARDRRRVSPLTKTGLEPCSCTWWRSAVRMRATSPRDAEWLGDIVVGSEDRAPGPCRVRRRAPQHDDRHLGTRTRSRLITSRPSRSGKPRVKQTKASAPAPPRFRAPPAPSRLPALEILGHRGWCEQAPDRRLVVDHQQRNAAAVHSGSLPHGGLRRSLRGMSR